MKTSQVIRLLIQPVCCFQETRPNTEATLTELHGNRVLPQPVLAEMRCQSSQHGVLRPKLSAVKVLMTKADTHPSPRVLAGTRGAKENPITCLETSPQGGGGAGGGEPGSPLPPQRVFLQRAHHSNRQQDVTERLAWFGHFPD